MLTALGKPAELKLHVRGALANGVYDGRNQGSSSSRNGLLRIPAGLDAFKAAHEVLKSEGALTNGAAVR